MQYGYRIATSCEEQQSNNLDEYSDDSDAESAKVRKAKKSKKTRQRELDWQFDMQPNR